MISSPPSHDNPIEMWVAKSLLVAITEDALVALRGYEPADDEDRQHTDDMILERERFLGWVNAQPGKTIFMGMYPALPQGGTSPLLN